MERELICLVLDRLVVMQALELRAVLEEARGVAGTHAHNAAVLVLDEGVHVAVVHEVDTLCQGGLLEGTRDADAVEVARLARLAVGEVHIAAGIGRGLAGDGLAVGATLLEVGLIHGGLGVHHLHALGEHPLEALDAAVGVLANDGAVVETRIHGDGIGMVEIHLFRRILDAPLLLPGVAAAGVREAVGQRRMAAHLEVGVDHDDAGALVVGTQGSKQTGSTCAAHDDVVLVVPRLRNLGLGCLGNHGLKRAGRSCGGGCCADTSHGQTTDETPARSARAHTNHPFTLGRSPACTMRCGDRT